MKSDRFQLPGHHCIRVQRSAAVRPCCVLAYRLAPRKGADRRDWSFVALVMGPIGLLRLLLLLLFGGRSARGRRKALEEKALQDSGQWGEPAPLWTEPPHRWREIVDALR
ncbi:hypothetical protein AB0D59_10645 [Streptomyces sp. NPDC048417]|uniref:hypothetical protein n=1 Tax=Streptomyces sp. NPDC048417 TaxID=3155387 RepID=UPI0034293670